MYESLAENIITLNEAAERFAGVGDLKRWRWLAYQPQRWGMEKVFLKAAGRVYVNVVELEVYLRRCAGAESPESPKEPPGATSKPPRAPRRDSATQAAADAATTGEGA